MYYLTITAVLATVFPFSNAKMPRAALISYEGVAH